DRLESKPTTFAIGLDVRKGHDHRLVQDHVVDINGRSVRDEEIRCSYHLVETDPVIGQITISPDPDPVAHYVVSVFICHRMGLDDANTVVTAQEGLEHANIHVIQAKDAFVRLAVGAHYSPHRAAESWQPDKQTGLDRGTGEAEGFLDLASASGRADEDVVSRKPGDQDLLPRLAEALPD